MHALSKCVLVTCLLITSPFASTHQFVAKLFTEVLGRAPNPGGWVLFNNELSSAGFSDKAFENVAWTFFSSQEYAALNYDNRHRVITLYRAALNRDPDNDGFQAWVSLLNSGTITFEQAVRYFFSCDEFKALLPGIRSPNPNGWRQQTATNFIMSIDHSNSSQCNEVFDGGTRADLQTLLDNVGDAGGGTVCLGENETVYIDQTLTIPARTTLRTKGSLTNRQYARFGRLIRIQTAIFDWVMVQMESGSSLMNVWIDGQESVIGHQERPAYSVRILGGTDTRVLNSKLSDAPSGTNIELFGALIPGGTPCSGAWVRGNVITAYTSNHPEPSAWDLWTDGISNHCEDAVIELNHILEATDVGIVLFGRVGVRQRSMIRNNLIVNAAHGAFAALGVDPMRGPNCDFRGAVIENNTFWTGPNAHYDIGITVGTRAWQFGGEGSGSGVVVRNNSTGGNRVIVNVGIMVADMSNATVTGNNLMTTITNTTGLPQLNLVSSNNGGGNNLQPGFVDVDPASITGQIGH